MDTHEDSRKVELYGTINGVRTRIAQRSTAGVPYASDDSLGVVMPDGTTMVVDDNGVIKAKVGGGTMFVGYASSEDEIDVSAVPEGGIVLVYDVDVSAGSSGVG